MTLSIRKHISPWLAPRKLNTYMIFICIMMLLAALYFEFYLNLKPCPLCLVERLLVVLMASLFFIGLTMKNRIAWCIQHCITCCAGLGACLVTGRHVWLQHVPTGQAPACGPELRYMLQHYSLEDTFSMLLRGTTDCATVQWRYLNHSMAEWVFIAFVLFSVVAFINLWRDPNRAYYR